MLRILDPGIAPQTLSGATSTVSAMAGTAVERRPTATVRQHYESAVLIVQGKATSLAGANHCAISCKLQHSNSTTSGWTDLDERLDDDGDVSMTLDGDEQNTVRGNYRLATASRYIRAVLDARHATDAAPGTALTLPAGDSVEMSVVLVLCGSDQTPADVATSDLGSITGNNAISQMGA